MLLFVGIPVLCFVRLRSPELESAPSCCTPSLSPDRPFRYPRSTHMSPTSSWCKPHAESSSLVRDRANSSELRQRRRVPPPAPLRVESRCSQ